MMPGLVGQRVGNCQVLEEIGRSSVSTVYKGYDPDLGCTVALKVLAAPFAEDPEFVQRFLRQAQATAQLKHPHLVTVLDAGQQDGLTWLEMEYLQGISLRELIRLQGPMLAEEALAIIRPLAGALDDVHRAGLLHGDVRAGNVIVCPPGRPLLTELGVVCTRWEGQIAGGAVSAAVTPEQTTGGELGPWTDLYALAALTYEMLGGRPPYAADTTAGLLSQIVHEPIPSLRPLRPDLPAAVGPVLERALAKEPRARYSTGAEFAAALAEAFQLSPGDRQEGRPAAAAPAPPALAPEAAPPTAGPLPPVRPPEPNRPPPWESVPIRAAPPPPPETPTAGPPTPRITRLPGTHAAPPSTPADRIANRRAAPGKNGPSRGKQGEPPRRRPRPWLWLLLGSEALLLLAGIVLIVLLVTGAL